MLELHFGARFVNVVNRLTAVQIIVRKWRREVNVIATMGLPNQSGAW